MRPPSTDDLVNELIGVSGDEPADSGFDSPRALVVSLWWADRDACCRMILASTALWANMPQMFDGVVMAARELNDRGYLSLLRRCANSDTTPINCAIAIDALLMEFDEHAEAGFEKRFRKQVDDVLAGRIRPDRVDFEFQLRDICRLRLAGLAPELEKLKLLCEDSRGDRYVFDASVKAYVDAALLWFHDGVGSLLRIASDPGARSEYRAACVYCLGCAGVRDVDEIARVYRGSGNGHMFDVRTACVEAIVFSGDLGDVHRFLSATLKTMATVRGIGRRSYNADVGLLLTAVYNLPCISSSVEKATEMWLDARNKDIAAMALLALERHGRQDHKRRRELGSHYRVNLELRKATPSPQMLMAYRRISHD